MENAYEAGFSRALQCLLDAEGDHHSGALVLLRLVQEKCWEEWGKPAIDQYDPRESKQVKVSGRGRGRPSSKDSPGKPQPSGEKWTAEEQIELSKKDYDPNCCRGRWWNGGYGAQCWREPATEGFEGTLCKSCQDRVENGKDFWGYYDEPLGSESEHKKNGGTHPWKQLREERVAKKDTEVKDKKEKKVKKAKKEKKKEKKEKKKGKTEEVANAEDQVEDLVPDTNEYNEGPVPESPLEEIVVDGVSLKWDKKTNRLLDIDDDTHLGDMIEEDGKMVPKILDDDTDDEEEEEENKSESDNGDTSTEEEDN